MKIKEEENLKQQSVLVRVYAACSVGNNVLNPSSNTTNQPTKIDEERLRRHVEEYPDAYLRERAELFGVSESAIRKAFKRMGTYSNARGRYYVLGEVLDWMAEQNANVT